MRKILSILICVLCSCYAMGQNPATTFTIPIRNITLPCGTTCTNFSVSLPHIKQSDDYVVTRPAYVPFAYTTPTGNEMTAIYSDDVFSSLISIPFPFCFYGSTYNSCVIGSNSLITFDASNASTANSWPLTTDGSSGSPVPIPYAGGTQNNSFSTYYPKATIMGPYHDIYPTTNGSGQRKIEWRVEGIAPNRRFVASYNSVPMFSCTTTYATHQMVFYESTGIVEIYVHDKPICTDWNEGLAILGLQNFNRDKAVVPFGKNCTVWGGLNIDSCYRFIPTAGTSRFVSAQLLVNGTPVATGDTSTTAPGVLNLNFNNICPTADSTAYVVLVKFTACGVSEGTVSFQDTVFVKKSAPAFTFVKTDANCAGNGSITITASGGSSPYQYSINGGNSYQSSNSFSNLASGNYNVTIRDNIPCTSTNQQVSIALVNNLTASVGLDTTICRGASFIRTVTANGTSISWSPSTGVSNPSIANPVLSPQNTTQYTITFTTGICSIQRTFTVTVGGGAAVNAGPDATILAGDVYPMLGSASAGTYLWTPSTGLSATNILNPNASPAATTTYTLQVTTPAGCIATDNMVLTVVPYCVKPMEAFTPNGDGINDLWLITNGNCLVSAKAQVFNRYGAEVFISEDYKNTWDGTYKGKPLPDGTYYFIISYQLVNGKTVYQKGNVTILR